MHIFCREKNSYRLLRSLRCSRNIRVHLSHDTAMYLSGGDFQKQVSAGKYILVAPRLDRESVVKWRSQEVHGEWRQPIVTKDVNLLPTFNSFVDTVANASTVYTDRLHVAILGAILSKETYLFPNSYHKNKSGYEFSLKRFPNVKFVNTNEFSIPE